jgi:hypothetical protein
MRLGRNILVTMGVGIGLLLLIVQPVAGVALATALVLTPVLLFGLIAVPRSLWPAADLLFRAGLPLFLGPERFQQPPPSFLQ